jgi:hypothetical protein
MVTSPSPHFRYLKVTTKWMKRTINELAKRIPHWWGSQLGKIKRLLRKEGVLHLKTRV